MEGKSSSLKYENLTEQIINDFYSVYNGLGYGFLEKVYQNGLYNKLIENDFSVKKELPIEVFFEGNVVGEFSADLLVDDKIVLELKAVETLATEHQAQLLNYLNATTYEVGLLLNFGPEPEIKRKVMDNDQKDYQPKK